jgi:hypothetical protein
MARPKKTVLPTTEPSVIRQPEWEGFTHGDEVTVSAPILEGSRGYKWEFRYHATNRITGSEWIEVFGGNRKYQGVRSFKIEEITLVPKKAKVRRHKGVS